MSHRSSKRSQQFIMDPKDRFIKPELDRIYMEEKNLLDENGEESASSRIYYRPNSNLTYREQRESLPIFRWRTNILYMVENFSVLIVEGETGCGKSTQIPQYLLEAGYDMNGEKQILVSQPRRIAAITLSKRVAEEKMCNLGEDVGYAIRFDDSSDSKVTKIKFVTDGLLIREIMSDPLLSKYSVVMVDEVHERSINTDIIVGLLRKILKKRTNNFKVIIASATLEAEKFKRFFETNESDDRTNDTCCILPIEGRLFPVKINYSLNPLPNYVKSTVDAVFKIHESEGRGDILAFLTGMEEIDSAMRTIMSDERQTNSRSLSIRVYPLYSSLPPKEQMRVFDRMPSNVRKVVLATNIAEASLTIDGISYVIDCGYTKIRAFNPTTGIESLITVPISKSSAEQRAGRAGRIKPGKVFRLYTEKSFDSNFHQHSIPEMQRVELSGALTQLKALGINNILRFNFISSPPAVNVARALQLMYALGVVDDQTNLTIPFGFRIAEYPLSPIFSTMLIKSEKYGCVEEIATIVAVMQIQSIYANPSKHKRSALKAHRKFAVLEGDHVTYLNIFEAFISNGKDKGWCHSNFLNYRGLCRANEIREHIFSLLKKSGIKRSSIHDTIYDNSVVRKSLTEGLFSHSARLHTSGSYYETISGNNSLYVHPTSVLYRETYPKYIIFNDVVQTNGQLYLRDISAVEAVWLCEIAPHYFQYGTDRELREFDNKNQKTRILF